MRRFFLIITLLAVGIAPNAAAQDSHYWDNQYGTKGELLGGLVVGTPSDLSATFYNPGWIALYGSSSVLLTTKAAEAYSIKLKDGLGRGTDRRYCQQAAGDSTDRLGPDPHPSFLLGRRPGMDTHRCGRRGPAEPVASKTRAPRPGVPSLTDTRDHQQPRQSNPGASGSMR
jgi:hypothetical protein